MAAKRLRGNPEGLVATQPTTKRVATYGAREDGTPKGPGFFGEIARTDEPELYSTELPATLGLTDPKTGTEILVPLIVPALTAEELAHLVDGGEPTRAIAQKAYTHAYQRLKVGKSPFAEPGESYPLPTLMGGNIR